MNTNKAKKIYVFRSYARAFAKSCTVTTNPGAYYLRSLDGYLAHGDCVITGDGDRDRYLYGTRDSAYMMSTIDDLID